VVSSLFYLTSSLCHKIVSLLVSSSLLGFEVNGPLLLRSVPPGSSIAFSLGFPQVFRLRL